MAIYLPIIFMHGGGIMKKTLVIMSMCAGMGYYAYKNRYKLKRIYRDMKELMSDEKEMLMDMM